jgi:hypothetical protein
MWGWVVGSLWSLAEWEPPLQDALVLLLLAFGVATVTALVSGVGRTPEASVADR